MTLPGIKDTFDGEKYRANEQITQERDPRRNYRDYYRFSSVIFALGGPVRRVHIGRVYY